MEVSYPQSGKVIPDSCPCGFHPDNITEKGWEFIRESLKNRGVEFEEVDGLLVVRK